MTDIVGTTAEPAVKSPPKPAPKSVPARDGLAKYAKGVNKRLGGR